MENPKFTPAERKTMREQYGLSIVDVSEATGIEPESVLGSESGKSYSIWDIAFVRQMYDQFLIGLSYWGRKPFVTIGEKVFHPDDGRPGIVVEVSNPISRTEYLVAWQGGPVDEWCDLDDIIRGEEKKKEHDKPEPPPNVLIREGSDKARTIPKKD